MSYAVVFGGHSSSESGGAASNVTKKSKKKAKATPLPTEDEETPVIGTAANAAASADAQTDAASQAGSTKKSRAPRKRATRKKQTAAQATDAGPAVPAGSEDSNVHEFMSRAQTTNNAAKHLWMTLSGVSDVRGILGANADVKSVYDLCDLMWKNLASAEKKKWAENVGTWTTVLTAGDAQKASAGDAQGGVGGGGKRKRDGNRKARAAASKPNSDGDVSAPKKKPKQNAYMTWVKLEGRAAVRAMFPDMGTSAIESAKRCGELWRAKSADEKAKWSTVSDGSVDGSVDTVVAADTATCVADTVVAADTATCVADTVVAADTATCVADTVVAADTATCAADAPDAVGTPAKV
jgi:hypothetical protein